MRENIIKLVQLGPLPSSESDAELIVKYEKLINDIVPPITNDEAKALTKLFGDDDCFGLAWSLIHLIETAPDVTLIQDIPSTNEWIKLLKKRMKNKTLYSF